MSDAERTLFVAASYRALLGRAPDQEGFDHYSGLLANGWRPDEVVEDLARSTEYRQRSPDAEGGAFPSAWTDLVRRLYGGFLDREPEAAGLDDYCSRLAAGTPLPEVVGSFLKSGEFRHRLELIHLQLAGSTALEQEERLRALSEVQPKESWPVEAQALRRLKTPAARGRAALVVTHSPDGSLKPHVGHLLGSLLDLSMEVVLVVQSDRSFCNIDRELESRLDGIFVRENKGYDFAAWAHILRAHPALLDAEELLLLNDSLLGPTDARSLAIFLDRLRRHPADLVGVTDSYERGWHIQSFLLLVKRPALRHDAFRSFFARVVAFRDKQDVIDTYECRLASVLMREGVGCGVLFEAEPGTTQNPMLHRWKALLEAGFPFVKVMAVRDRSEGIVIADWRQDLAGRGYDVSLADAVLDHAHLRWSDIGATSHGPDAAGSTKMIGLAAPDGTGDLDPEALEPPVDDDWTWSPVLDDSRSLVVSFDVWSTLLHRSCHPDEIKLQSARHLFLIAHRELRPAYRDPLVLFRARVDAENRSAPHADFEYRFAEAIAVWLEDALVPSASPERRAALTEALVAHELQAEHRSTRPDERLRRFLTTLRRPAIFTSDFYMPAAFIRQVLDRHGMASAFVKGFSSCDGFVNKRSGKLFAVVLDDFQLEPRQLTHVGDNPTADVEVPASLGINAIRYRAHDEERLHAWQAEAFHAFVGGDPHVHQRRIGALLDMMAREAAQGAGDGAELLSLGIRHAPLAVSFCLHVLQEALKAGDETVYFFTREGVLLQQIFDRVVAEDPFATKRVRSKLLSVSRMATFAASLQDGSSSELMRLWSLYSSQSVEALGRSLGLSDEVMRSASRRCGLLFEKPIFRPWAHLDFLRLWSDPAVKAHVAERIGAQRHALERYLDQAGFGLGRTPPRVVDIGWRGSIQDNLSRLLGRPIEGHYLALLAYLNPQPVGSRKHGWLSDANLPTRFLLEDQVAPLEMLFNAPGGSVRGYAERDGAMEPVLDRLEDEDSVALKLAPYRDGILHAVPALCRYVRLHGLTADILLGPSRGIAARIIADPPAVLADLFAELSHNELFGTGRVHRVGGNADLGEILAKGEGPHLHHGLSAWLDDVRWPSGAVRQSAVTRWYAQSSFRQRMSLPLAVSAVCAPAVQAVRGDRVVVYAPAPLAHSGGHRTIFNTVRRLSRLGLVPHICLPGGDGLDIVEEYLGPTRARIETRWRDDLPSEFALATIANSAAFVSHRVDAVHKCYLVQDAEALFNPIGDAYVVAENSYALGLTHFTIGTWLTHVIGRRYGGRAVPAGLGVDAAVYRPLPEVDRVPAVCMLYQPDKPRRASELGLQALRILKQSRPDLQLYLYGSDAPVHLDFEAENLGVISDLRELNALYNRCTAGLCISLSNPSRIPFEMAAAGCMPVDLYRHNNLFDYGDGGAVLAYQSAKSLAAALEAAMSAMEQPGARDALITSMQGRTLDWEVDTVAAAVLELARGGALPDWDPSPAYTSDPHLAPDDQTPSVLAFCRSERRLTLP